MKITTLFLLFLVSLLFVHCESVEDPDPIGDVEISISASGLSDGKLAINNRATFTANLTGYEGNLAELTFRWSLSFGNGALSDGSNSLGVGADAGPSIGCVGRARGVEEINVLVLDADNQVLGAASLVFEIVASEVSGIDRGCFDQPKFIFSNGSFHFVANFDGTGRQYIGIAGTGFSAISPDGQWFAWTIYDEEAGSRGGWVMHVQRCDGTDLRRIEGGTGDDYNAKFSPDSKTLYFLRPDPSQQASENYGRLEITAYDLESKELRFLTSLYKEGPIGASVDDFTINPLTGDLAFFKRIYQIPEGGGSAWSTELVFMQSETGLVTYSTANVPSRNVARGMDWSPDGEDIIFAAGTEADGPGLFRIEVAEGSKALMLFPHNDPNRTQSNPFFYYAGGSRIAFRPLGAGPPNTSALWSIDANGGDLQPIPELFGVGFFMGVLH
ncbi:TolB family protein [Algoriphagus namhaensis]